MAHGSVKEAVGVSIWASEKARSCIKWARTGENRRLRNVPRPVIRYPAVVLARSSVLGKSFLTRDFEINSKF